ncbi:MAG: hypothetical protein E7573_11895 [Ruminococcaceae bacterium]|nr:hypothetical protein [Oscillospiraceae bacterium]MBR3598225.1 hypothetical protein [Clostridia bacterium]
MKNFRRFLSVFLSVLMLMSAFAVVSSAEDCNHLYEATNVAPTCVESGYTLYACPLCGDSYKDYKNGLPSLGHNYGDWKTLQEVSCIDEGYQQRDCSRCGSSEVKTIPIIDHNDKNYDGKCDFCALEIGTTNTISPFDWLVALFKAIVQWFKDIFA